MSTSREPNPECWKLRWDAALRPALVWALRDHWVDRLLGVIQLDWRRSKLVPRHGAVVPSVERIFRGRVLSSWLTSEWPGTVLADDVALVFEAQFDSKLARAAAVEGPRLRDWNNNRENPLPEDLCLFRSGGCWPTLVSITHEGDAWVLSSSEPSIRGLEPWGPASRALLVPRGRSRFLARNATRVSWDDFVRKGSIGGGCRNPREGRTRLI
jgi:hypothetical protein